MSYEFTPLLQGSVTIFPDYSREYLVYEQVKEGGQEGERANSAAPRGAVPRVVCSIR
jgi:hypothetical protein